jgi:hypothetical protein
MKETAMNHDMQATIPRSSWLRATALLPPSIQQWLEKESGAAVSSFIDGASRYHTMSDSDLLRATEVCLRNLERLDDSAASPDVDLRTALVPELWERLQSGTRNALRRLTSTLAEYAPAPFWRQSRLWSAEREAALCEEARQLRLRVTQLARVDTAALIEQVRFAIAGSRAADRWGPTACVYEPGFTYRLVPALALRVRTRQGVNS